MKYKVVVVGGGTGTHTVLRGLKLYAEYLDITAIVSMADSGGSSGRLRDEFGQLPAGDVRNALTALAADNDKNDLLLRQLFLYRFDRGTGLAGHSFGNLFITALTEILGSEEKAIEAAASLLRVSGRVIPATIEHTHIKATYADGREVLGEHLIDSSERDLKARIVNLELSPSAKLNPKAALALKEANLIVLGPGDLYTSVLANCVVNGFKEALAETGADIIYVCNLMSKVGQTVGFHAAEHLAEVEKYLKRKPTAIILNTSELPADIVAHYASEGNHPILNNCTRNDLIIYAAPLVGQRVDKHQADILDRSLIRHNPAGLAEILFQHVSRHRLHIP